MTGWGDWVLARLVEGGRQNRYSVYVLLREMCGLGSMYKDLFDRQAIAE
jgi:hypothetical protein